MLRSDMTVPIARVVATRYADRRAAAALLLLRALLPRRAPAARPAARVAAGRDRADRRARARGHRRGAHGAVPRARRDRARTLPRRARRRLAVPGADGEPRRPRGRCARRCSTRSCGATSSASSTALATLGARATRRRELLLEVPAAARRPRRAARAARPGRRRRRRAARRSTRCSQPEVAARVIFDLGLVRTSATTRAPCSRSTTPRSASPIGGGGRYDDLLGRFGRALPAVGFALEVERLHMALAGEERAPGTMRGEPREAGLAMSLGRPDDRGAARRAVRRTRSTARRGSASTPPELRSNERKLLFEDIGLITMRPSDVPTYVEAGAADLGITGKDVLMEQAHRARRRARPRGLRAARPRLRALHDGPRDRRRPATPAAEALRRLGVIRVATKYPRVAARALRAHRPPGRDRRGQGLGRARAADGAGRGDRRPHRDRHDAAREQPRDPRGDRAVHRAADRQPGRAQAQGGARSTTCWTLACGLSGLAERVRARRASLGGADATDSAGRRRGRRASAGRAGRRAPPARARPRRRRRGGRGREIIAAVAPRGDAAVLELHRALRHRRRRSRALVAPEELDDALDAADRRASCAGLQVAIANVAQVAEAGVQRGPRGRRCRRATGASCASCRSLGRRLRARRPRALPEHGRDGRRHRARRRRDRRRRLRPAGPRDRPADRSAPARCSASSEVYRMGGAQAIAALAYGTETVRRASM